MICGRSIEHIRFWATFPEVKRFVFVLSIAVAAAFAAGIAVGTSTDAEWEDRRA
jgi:hypothetical protein